MCANWRFWRRDEETRQPEDPGSLLPGHKGIGVSQDDVVTHLQTEVSPDGRLKVKIHRETSRRNDTLGPTTGPRPEEVKRQPGLEGEPMTRGRMILLLCDVRGLQGPQDVAAAGQNEAECLGEVGRVLKELSSTMSLGEFCDGVSRAYEARIPGVSKSDVDRRSLRLAAEWLKAKAKDTGMK